ncbi:SpoIIE family protein phosphatase [Amycolatopsis arida]|uniref:SpoIIE family protein phosphatase n=1 Tax=Amycolatopsis arida TaxID=587909 RepID=UPI0015A535ED|nr:SpoIIE family protein phosphatase [Amycolatopsis arida]
MGQARVAARTAARGAGLTEHQVQQVALAATELATNLLRHATEGAVLARHDGERVEVIAVDRGPGLTSASDSMRDGYSTGGTLGTGLGAVRRAAATFDLYSRPGVGTAVLARWPALPPARNPWAWGVEVAAPGEEVCGDAYAVLRADDRLTLVVSDGLGHGPEASVVSKQVVEVARAHAADRPRDLLGALHRALAGGRGAAVAVAQLDVAAATLRYAGMGNISGRLVDRDTGDQQALLSVPGIVGMPAARSRFGETVRPWPPDGQLLMHSDGLTQRWRLADWPGIEDHDPVLVAAWVLWHTWRRRDDACLAVLASTMP